MLINMSGNTKCFLVIIFALAFSVTTQAQCAMCRAALESGEGNVKGEAVNDGIVYLMIFPYLLVGLVGYAVYRSRKNKRKKAAQ